MRSCPHIFTNTEVYCLACDPHQEPLNACKCGTILDIRESICWACEQEEAYESKLAELENNPITDAEIEASLDEGISNLQRATATMESLHSLPRPHRLLHGI